MKQLITACLLIPFAVAPCLAVQTTEKQQDSKLESTAQAETSLKAPIEGGVLAKDMTPDDVTKKARAFFAEWLKSHGEKEIINDGTGVGVKGKRTRLWAFHYKGADGTKKDSSEVEFRVVLPDGREIQEFVAGMGAQDNVVDSAISNFAMSTFHTVYACCLNEEDPHVVREEVEIGGKNYEYTTVGLFHMSNSKDPIDFNPVTDEIKKTIAQSNLKLEGGIHWMKIVYGQNENKPIITSVTFDNRQHTPMTEKIKALQWPESDGFYMGKQFLMFRPKTNTEKDIK
jgi:hypothetical protein